MKHYSVIDLFSGCGGLSYGFLQAGYKVLLGIDNDEAALKTFSFNHPEAKAMNKDISKIKSKDLLTLIGEQKIDLIIGGPPCQGFSLSGPRRFNDSRNTLYLSFIRLVKELKPKAFLIENVPGIIGLYGGTVRDKIIKKFEDTGYNVNYQKLDAADYGIPQLRQRVFFVGLYKSKSKFEFPCPSVNLRNYATLKQAVDDLPSLEKILGDEVMPYSKNGRLSNYQKDMRVGASHIHNHIGTDHTEKTKHIISFVPEGGNYKDLPKEYSKTRNFHVAWTRLDGRKPATTVDTGHRHHFHYCYNRVPTVRESARIQSFPDKFVFLGNKTQQYKQVGNAVPPLLAKTIAEQLRKFL